MPTIHFKHWVTQKKTATKLAATAEDKFIKIEIREGREQYGKITRLDIGEALLLADWLRESALGLLREQVEIVDTPDGWL